MSSRDHRSSLLKVLTSLIRHKSSSSSHSPSGCTFWGKKPWSRKKKILWQLGLLIGAPLGIALMAGVAVPAIIIGLPFWVARKVDNLQVC